MPLETIYSSRKKILLSEIITLEAVRRALRDVSSIKALTESPLMELSMVYRQARSVNPYGSSIAKGRALKAILQEAVESLRPDEGTPNPNDKRWRSYLILQEQYFYGRSPDWIQTQLSISKATYFFEQKKAIEQIAHYLMCQEEESYAGSLEENMAIVSPAVSEFPLIYAPPLLCSFMMGRDEIIDSLIQDLSRTSRPAAISLFGLPGVGKTTIALALANHAQMRELFPDGVLWACLGCTPRIYNWLVKWATSLGVSEEIAAQTSNLKELAVLLSETIGMRSMLIILDDVWQLSSALALKVGGPHCAYLLTTRLIPVAVGFSGEHTLQIHELNEEDSVQLISAYVPQMAASYSSELYHLVHLAGGLPFTLNAMGRYLQKESYYDHPRRIAQAFSLLEQSQTRMHLEHPLSPLESSNDLPLEVPLSLYDLIHISETMLEKEAQQAIFRLADFPSKPSTITEEEALSILGVDPHVLDHLVDNSLIECLAPNGYTIPRAIRDYAVLRKTQSGEG